MNSKIVFVLARPDGTYKSSADFDGWSRDITRADRYDSFQSAETSAVIYKAHVVRVRIVFEIL